jgi:hypothetical protein
MNACPSKKYIPGNRTPIPASRPNVMVTLCTRRSILPESSIGNRLAVFRGRNSTLPASPSSAAATALQKSGSPPCHLPVLSLSANPANSSFTPQRTIFRVRTSSRTSPAKEEGHRGKKANITESSITIATHDRKGTASPFFTELRSFPPKMRPGILNYSCMPTPECQREFQLIR